MATICIHYNQWGELGVDRVFFYIFSMSTINNYDCDGYLGCHMT